MANGRWQMAKGGVAGGGRWVFRSGGGRGVGGGPGVGAGVPDQAGWVGWEGFLDNGAFEWQMADGRWQRGASLAVGDGFSDREGGVGWEGVRGWGLVFRTRQGGLGGRGF